jgi:RNA polymerase sigma-70 factor (ECF subfamily)
MTTTLTPRSDGTNNFSALIDESYQKVYNMAYRLSGNRQDAEDLTQEACYRAFRSFDDFEGDRPFTNWIFRIVTRLYLDLKRSRSRRVREVSLEVPVVNTSDKELRREPADPRPNPEMELLNGVISEEFQNALNGLSRGQLDLVKMADLTDVDNAEIASRLSLHGGTVRSRLHRAHLQMRNQLTGKSTPKSGHKPAESSTPSPIRRAATPTTTSNWMTTSFVRLVEKFG